MYCGCEGNEEIMAKEGKRMTCSVEKEWEWEKEKEISLTRRGRPAKIATNLTLAVKISIYYNRCINFGRV